MPVEILIDTDVVVPGDLESQITAAFAATTELTDPELATLDTCIRLCGEAVGTTLNQQFRGKDGATNVLSFPADEDALLGDIALCWPVVEREADQQGKTVGAHTAHLTVHGLLHLMGYDHVEDEAAEKMEALEIEVLATLQIANPYLPH